MTQKTLIPKIIHLTWFSGEDFPRRLQQCINTWGKILPDYEIKIWNMDMARELNIPYINEALDARKWAFASDVVRAYAVWHDGGVYMDTDIWLKKRFDELMNKPMVFFMERNDMEWKKFNSQETLDNEGHCLVPNYFIKGRQIQAAMFMGNKGHWALKAIVEHYKNVNFINNDGSVNIEDIAPSRYAKVLEKYGFLYADRNQELNDVSILNSSYVAVSKYECKNNTIAVHLGEHLWDKRSPFQQIKYKIRTSPFYKYIYPIKKILDQK